MERTTCQHKSGFNCGLIQAYTQDILVSNIIPVEGFLHSVYYTSPLRMSGTLIFTLGYLMVSYKLLLL